MKLIPASRALATTRPAVASSVGPPNIIVPRQIGETLRPERPSVRYCMGSFQPPSSRYLAAGTARSTTTQVNAAL